MSDSDGGVELDDNAGRRLAIHRIAEPRTPHPIHHAANPLAQLLGVAEIGAHSAIRGLRAYLAISSGREGSTKPGKRPGEETSMRLGKMEMRI